jgi:hypothetical protein
MFSMISNSGRKLGTMSCCKVQRGRRQQHGWRQSTSGCVSSGALLVLLPKCPMCIAAYLTLWTGASIAMPVAMHLRSLAAILFVASMCLLGFRWAVVRFRSGPAHGNFVVAHKGASGPRKGQKST